MVFRAILIFVLLLPSNSHSQGITNHWIFGYGSYWGAPGGHTYMDFSSGTPVITYDSLEMDFNRTATAISNTAGNLLFYTNGYYIADASHDTMMNGSAISPTGYQSLNPLGLLAPQACLIIPWPDSSHLYWLFHNTLDNAPFYNRSLTLYTSLIDMNQNGGLGAVMAKNQVLLQDTLLAGKITACKHANGRDWWVICMRASSNIYYKYLVTPYGISGPFVQSIGTQRTWSLGMTGFSPDGNWYAYFNADYQAPGTLDLYNFDRCTGMLSNPILVTIPQTSGHSGGLAFSPNSRYLYTANIDSVYQFDLYTANVPASKTTVAIWDGFYSPSPPFAAVFEVMQLAPDGKIYTSTGNGTFHMHVMNHPDSAGLACNFVQHDIQFQRIYVNGIPNHPNYFLGKIPGSPCDTISSVQSLSTGEVTLHAYPNPAQETIQISFPVQSQPGELVLYDVNGKAVLREYVAPWSQFKRLALQSLPNGVYMGKMIWPTNSGSLRIIKAE